MTIERVNLNDQICPAHKKALEHVGDYVVGNGGDDIDILFHDFVCPECGGENTVTLMLSRGGHKQWYVYDEVVA